MNNPSYEKPFLWMEVALSQAIQETANRRGRECAEGVRGLIRAVINALNKHFDPHMGSIVLMAFMETMARFHEKAMRPLAEPGISRLLEKEIEHVKRYHGERVGARVARIMDAITITIRYHGKSELDKADLLLAFVATVSDWNQRIDGLVERDAS